MAAATVKVKVESPQLAALCRSTYRWGWWVILPLGLLLICAYGWMFRLMTNSETLQGLVTLGQMALAGVFCWRFASGQSELRRVARELSQDGTTRDKGIEASP